MSQRDKSRHGFSNAHQAAENDGSQKEQSGNETGDPFQGIQGSRLMHLDDPNEKKNEQPKPNQLVNVEENGTIGLSGMMQPIAGGEDQKKEYCYVDKS